MATKAFRFALGTAASPRSGLWRVWTREDEVHLSVHAAREMVEFTAYPTGRWRIVIGDDVSRWTRPKEFRPGWTRGPDLVIPHCGFPIALSPTEPPSAEPVTWLAEPAPLHQARFTLLFAGARAAEGRWQPQADGGMETLVVLPLRTGGHLHFCRVDEPLGSDDTPATAGASRLALSVVVSADQAGRPSLIEAHHA